MPEKKLFVLANSIKKQQRCIAEIEIVIAKDGKEYWGDWIRPVTHHDEGAISMSECRMQEGAIPVPLDVVQVPLTSSENSATQPENWFIKQDGNWTKITSWSKKEAQQLVETPRDLWLEPGVKQDRVRPQYLLSQKSHQSLYLIRPVNFRFVVEINDREGIEKKRIRGVFNYNRKHYDFSMTDPFISQKYFPDFGSVPSGVVEIEEDKDVLICVSLTPEFKGYHYKIVATVIEL